LKPSLEGLLDFVAASDERCEAKLSSRAEATFRATNSGDTMNPCRRPDAVQPESTFVRPSDRRGAFLV